MYNTALTIITIMIEPIGFKIMLVATNWKFLYSGGVYLFSVPWVITRQ